MILINPLTHPSVGSIEGFRYKQFIKYSCLLLLATAIAFCIFNVLFQKKDIPKQNGDDKG